MQSGKTKAPKSLNTVVRTTIPKVEVDKTVRYYNENDDGFQSKNIDDIVENLNDSNEETIDIASTDGDTVSFEAD